MVLGAFLRLGFLTLACLLLQLLQSRTISDLLYKLGAATLVSGFHVVEAFTEWHFDAPTGGRTGSLIDLLTETETD